MLWSGILSSSVYLVFHGLVRVVAVTAEVFEPSTSWSENHYFCCNVFKGFCELERQLPMFHESRSATKTAFTMVLFFPGLLRAGATKHVIWRVCDLFFASRSNT